MNEWPPAPAQLTPLIEKLDGVHRVGENQWEARCPNPDHLDLTPSFGFRAGDTRPVIGSCQRGCTWSEIESGLAQLNVDVRTIKAPAMRQAADADQDDVRPVAAAELARFIRFASAPQSDKALKLLEFLLVTRGLRLETVLRAGLGYNPRDGRVSIPVQVGADVVNVRQYKPGATEQKFLQVRGHGGARLYPESALHDNTLPVLLTEGELDALLANQEGLGLFVAVTGTGGATNPPRDLGTLRGREVFVAYDADDAGRKGAVVVQAALEKAGATSYILDLTRLGLPSAEKKGEDITDLLLHRGGSARALEREMHRLRRSSKAGETRHVVRKASEIQSRRQLFLWRDRMPMGTITLFAGSGGVGKSTFALWLLAELQHGRLPGDLEGTKATVLYVSVEDDWATVVKPRLTAAGADADRVYQLAVRSGTDESTGERYPLLPEDVPAIRGAIEDTQADLVIFDPITSTVTGDDHKRGDVRAVLDPLAQLAQETNTAIVGIMHFKKGAGDVSDKVSGSHAYRDTARALMLFAKDEQTGEVIMTQDKGNYADFGSLSLAYRLVDTVVALDDGDTAHVAKVEIVGDTTTSVSQIVNRSSAPDEIAAWVLDYMESMGGKAPAGEAKAAGSAAGFSDTALTRARVRARVKTRKTPSMDGGWEWFLEETAQ